MGGSFWSRGTAAGPSPKAARRAGRPLPGLRSVRSSRRRGSWPGASAWRPAGSSPTPTSGSPTAAAGGPA
eukprot:2892292-Alexandrium_andersonii.AAC.1